VRGYREVRMTSTALFILGSLSVVVGITAIVLAFGIYHSALRSEEMGNERLEILREQHERLELLREERRMLLEELRGERDRRAELERAWREGSVEQENGQVMLSVVRGAIEGAPRRRWWEFWR
jgi:uncharacterized protein HemX